MAIVSTTAGEKGKTYLSADEDLSIDGLLKTAKTLAIFSIN